MFEHLSLSERGRHAFSTELRKDYNLFFQASENLYHPKTNPMGSFPLNIAENKLNWEMLKAKLETISSGIRIPEWVAGYSSNLGHEGLRNALSIFLKTFVCGDEVNPFNIGIASGATAVIELTSMILGDIGDVVVFPAPSYPVYGRDINNKAGLERYNLQTHHEIAEIKDGPVLSIFHLEHAKLRIESQGKRFRILVLTNPDNPTGGIYSLGQLETISDWCIKNKIHLVVNEIYALSLLDTTHWSIADDYSGSLCFNSIIKVMNSRKSQYLHQWYALSKDFGLSGMRVGMVYTFNTAFLTAFNNLSLPHLVSNHTQWLMEHLLTDEQFMRGFLGEQQIALTDNYVIVVNLLKTLDIPYVPARGSLFVWADFSSFLEQQNILSETIFWENLYEYTGVLLTPGDGFAHHKPGMFRIVHSCFNAVDLQVAMERMDKYLKGLSRSR